MLTYLIIMAILFYLLYLMLRPRTRTHIEHDTYAGSSLKEENRDNWEGTFWEVRSPRNQHANLRIEYKDGKGARTERNITVMKYGAWEGGAILWAFCQLRDANRTFRTDRVLSCVDLDTGEVIGDLAAWLDKRYEASPDRALEKLIDTAWNAIRVLYFICHADGRLTQKERAVVRDAVRSLNDHPEIDDKRIDDLFDSIDSPTLAGFKMAFGRLINTNLELAGKVVAWSENIIDTEQTVSAAEQEALEYLRNRFLKGQKQAAAAKN